MTLQPVTTEEPTPKISTAPVKPVGPLALPASRQASSVTVSPFRWSSTPASALLEQDVKLRAHGAVGQHCWSRK